MCGEGIYLWDERGARYLDAIAGVMVSALGQGNARAPEAMARQATALNFTYMRYARHQPTIALARRVSELAGAGFERCGSARLAWLRIMCACESAQ